ncbi:YicC/YloC family endoribonuclease [Candidatus Riesia pediculicola]|uniref:YicC family protein n=1 Tax=Riesia pediculicola (strain USDA) TaxID=515618 RepID=D4G7K6_RIEPU|nr:YicC/YloC family endoribonuclease [Candidatus Riesia pediculicola]ADD79617.1 conserved hypothetical protein [Candidatus Riesia pediculicola USDA]ARC53584.1 hypothetical protein AOE55_00195 [Candidatus Riesia pediculicola]QOJ86239.1 YicC family protein [Candidatus Riesia pediculicola]
MLGMTAYAKKNAKNQFGNFTLEIFSLNHKNLEISIKLPEEIQNMEFFIEKFIRRKIDRGKLRFILKFEPSKYFDQIDDRLFIDKRLVFRISKFLNWIENKIKIDSSCSMDLLKWPGVIRKRQDNDYLNGMMIFNAFLSFNLSELIDDLILYKRKEGNKVKKVIQNKLENLEEKIRKIRSLIPESEIMSEKRLRERLDYFNRKIEIDFLKKDILTILRQSDISEEIDRINFHIQLSKDLIQKDYPIGKRINFIFQEINRESNTISSKSNHIDIINLAIEIKVLVEQAKEHVQNIE